MASVSDRSNEAGVAYMLARSNTSISEAPVTGNPSAGAVAYVTVNHSVGGVAFVSVSSAKGGVAFIPLVTVKEGWRLCH